jgi:hypothetical protein
VTPQQLHALASLWSLQAVWPHLVQAAQRATEAADPDRGTVQAWRPGSGTHSGQVPNVVLAAILRSERSSPNPYAERLHRTLATLSWLADSLKLRLLPADALPGLVEAAPGWPADTALHVARHVADEDRAVRKLLREGSGWERIAGWCCPYCDTAGSLAIRAAGPPLQRLVICTAGCTCNGPATGPGMRDCPCRMGVLVEGLPHIWTYDQLDEAINAGRVA